MSSVNYVMSLTKSFIVSYGKFLFLNFGSFCSKSRSTTFKLTITLFTLTGREGGRQPTQLLKRLPEKPLNLLKRQYRLILAKHRKLFIQVLQVIQIPIFGRTRRHPLLLLRLFPFRFDVEGWIAGSKGNLGVFLLPAIEVAFLEDGAGGNRVERGLRWGLGV